MASERENTVCSIFGRKGSGKTFLARRIMRAYPRVIILDTLGEYGERATIVEGRDDSIRAIRDACERKRFRLALRVLEPDDLLDVLTMAWECSDSLLVLEETSMVCSPVWLPPELARLVRYGRHRSISQLYIARRPAEIPRDLTAQSDVIISFQQTEPRDLAYLQAVGFDASHVANLPRYRLAMIGEKAKFPLPALLQLTRQPKGAKRPLVVAEPDPEPETPTPEPDASMEAT
jgi:Helicase HerA, central domain